MKRSCFPFVILVLLAGLWLGLLIGLYQKGQEKEAVIYAHIPEETIRFIDGLLDMIDQSIRFDPDPALTDWDNDTNYGEDEATGLLKLEDDYFVVYFRKGDKEEEKKAGKTLRWAHDAIEPLASLMGKYPYPKDVKGRKLPIYLASSQKEYTRIISYLMGNPNLKEQTGSWGMYICTYSCQGCLTKGIVLHPGTWGKEKDAHATLWHEMNHYVFYTSLDYSQVIDPYLWVSEGVAEYFSKGDPVLDGPMIERLQKEHLDRTFKFVYDNYAGGQSVYTTLHKKYGEQTVRNFIRLIYANRMVDVYPKALQKSSSQFENEWKSYLPAFR